MNDEGTGHSVRLAAMVPRTRALGPGERFAIWLQGCPFSCPGCIAPEFLPMGGGRTVSSPVLARRIAAEAAIDGVSISGGEPFAQASGLAALVEAVRERTNLGILVFSGYTLQELRRRARTMPAIGRVLGSIDLLIDGRYRHELNDSKGLRGSTNQCLHYLTPRYAGTDDRLQRADRTMELHDTRWGQIYVGLPPLASWQKIVLEGEDPPDLIRGDRRLQAREGRL